MAADNNDHKILLIPLQNYASSVRSVISERLFTISGGIHSPSVVDTDFTFDKKLLCLVFCNSVKEKTPPTESEAHAIGVVGIVVGVVTRSVDIGEVGAVVDIRRTQPPTTSRHSETISRMNPVFCYSVSFWA